jgi:glyoxylate reductase
MNQKKPVVFLTRRLPESTETRMRELFDAHLRDRDTPLSHEELCAAVQSADVLVPTVTDRIDAAGDRRCR